jgi:peptidoglycan/LPS O-acetylase OafA/YrhL
MSSWSSSREPARDPRIDAFKALASQCIVLHHLAIYGPMPDIAAVLIPGVVHWLDVYGRYAVQVFLVMGGYLAAPGLWRAPPLVPSLLRRLRRLLPTLWAALALVLLVTALIRFGLGPDHTPGHTPEWPDGPGLLANLLLLQDVLDLPALSAGLWYVAIDFQLYALLALLIAILHRLGRLAWAEVAVVSLTAISLGIVNLDTGWEMWAPYFFGAYGLGVLAWRASQGAPRERAGRILIMLLLAGLALGLAWRDRIALAGIVALVLALKGLQPRVAREASVALPALRATLDRSMHRLGRISYSVFLVHYPVCLGMNALATFVPPEPLVHVGLLLATWWLSLKAASLLHRQVEERFSA